ncbi:MAG: hypothetical protein EXS31_13445 [Pedosphaera sp.]|nr:hypothetical protein [Pedosphaera sp.]
MGLATLGLSIDNTSAEPTPLKRAHAHNDYEHTRPLLDALDQGFCSVEADIYLVEGKLLVAHDLKDAKPARTLEALYLEPLAERARRNGGRIYPGGPSVTLLVDVKSEADATYKALDLVLGKYPKLLTRFTRQRVETNAVTIIVSGNRARETMAKQPERYAALDGRVSDLDHEGLPDFIPLISDNWRAHFTWQGTGNLSAEDETKLKNLVDRAHRRGCRIRFWGVPDQPDAWSMLLRAGVDLINTDNLPGLRRLITESKAAD